MWGFSFVWDISVLFEVHDGICCSYFRLWGVKQLYGTQCTIPDVNTGPDNGQLSLLHSFCLDLPFQNKGRHQLLKKFIHEAGGHMTGSKDVGASQTELQQDLWPFGLHCRGWSLHLHCEQLMCEYVSNDCCWQSLVTDEPL